VLQCVAICCNVLRCVAVCCTVLPCVAIRCSALQCVALCCNVLPFVAVRCNVLQCVAMCCGALHNPFHEAQESVALSGLSRFLDIGLSCRSLFTFVRLFYMSLVTDSSLFCSTQETYIHDVLFSNKRDTYT